MTARILIIDDVPANTRLLEARLGAEYYHVRSARDGYEGLETAMAWQPDLILLDIMMPGMDGYTCCQLLKTNPSTMHIPVVMVTALGESNERLTGLAAGADDFLTKPADYDTLKARIGSLVRLKRLLDEWRARGRAGQAFMSADVWTNIREEAGSNVLVVNDSPKVDESIKLVASSEGYNLFFARSIEAARKAWRGASIGLAIINTSRSDEDPFRYLAGLRASDEMHDVPVLLIVEAGERELLRRGFELGANDWVIHPIDSAELKLRCRNQMRRKVYQDSLKSSLDRMVGMALTDPLTGVYNRAYLGQYLSGLDEDILKRDVAVMMIDVDHFKSINDKFGHLAGDEVLRQIAVCLKRNVRLIDTVARYGGEEFVVVMPAISRGEAAACAERVRSTVEATELPIGDNRLSLTVSVGWACASLRSVGTNFLLSEADNAMYSAKKNGRNRVAPLT